MRQAGRSTAFSCESKTDPRHAADFHSEGSGFFVFFDHVNPAPFDARNCVSLAFTRETLYTFAARRLCMASVLKKRRKKMRKHKYKKLRRRLKFLRRKG